VLHQDPRLKILQQRTGVRRAWLVVAAAITALVLFAAFLIASFPYNDTVSALLSPYQLKLIYAAQHQRLPLGVELEDASLISTATAPNQMLLDSPSVALTPTLGSLFFGDPGLRVRAALYAGTVAATVRRHAGAVNLAFALKSLDLAQCAPLQQFGSIVTGTLSGTGTAQLRGPDLSDNPGESSLAGRDLTFALARSFPPIHLGALTGRLLLADGTLTFQEIETHGVDLDAKADGAIQLAPDPADSTIAARVYLTPTASGRAHFGLFLNMLPHSPSAGPYYLRGPLRWPSIR
jgi:type II secretion system protein N